MWTMRITISRRFVPATLLAIHAGLLAYGAAVHSPCIDEVGHMAAGLSHWQLGRFALYHVNPPLVRAVAVLPVLAAHPKTDWSAYSDAPGARSEFAVGRNFITINGERSFWYFTWARWACIPFALLGGAICYCWAKELYGDWSGVVALILWCFGPNILANAQMITPDTGATTLGATAAYFFWKWLKRPVWWMMLAAGVALGLALLTKTTWILLFALWPALWLFWQASGGRKPPDSSRKWPRQLLQLSGILLLGLYLLNLGYAFEGSMTPLGRYSFVSEALGGPTEPGFMTAGNRFAGTWLGAVPVPLPRNYVEGIDVQKRDFESHYWSYLRGEWRQEGWWYYYLYGLAVKVPLGVWALALLAAWTSLLRWASRGRQPPEGAPSVGWRDELTLLAPAVVVLTLVSAETGFNHHLRYVLPIFPFCFIWMSKAVRALGRKAWLRAGLTVAAVLAAVGSSLWVYPHSMSYFNELAGGPENGSAHLVDSNIDWGQDLLFLRDWLKQHPQAKPLRLAYFGYVDPRIAGITFIPPPLGPTSPGEAAGPQATELGPQPGWYAVSVSMMRGYAHAIPDGRGGLSSVPLQGFSYFQRFDPVGHAGWSIYIYHITADNCAQVRWEMGLPDLGDEADVPERKK